MKNYNRGTERDQRICYRSFIEGLRLPLAGQRLQIVEQAFRKIAEHDDAQCFTVRQARDHFAFEEFDKWCDAIELPNSDSEIVSWETFRDFYADISLTIYEDKKFLAFLSESWSLCTSSYTVTSKDVETLVAAMRHNLQKFGNARYTEEYILRDLYREIVQQDASGNLTRCQLVKILSKINLRTNEKYLDALLQKMESYKDNTVEFEEFVYYIVSEPYHRY